MKVKLHRPNFERIGKDVYTTREIDVKEITPFIFMNEGMRDKKGLRLKTKYKHIIKNEYFWMENI